MTKDHRLGCFNTRHLFLTDPEGGKSKTKVTADLVSGEDSLPGLQMATFLLCKTERERERERERGLLSLFSYTDTDSIMGAPLL